MPISRSPSFVHSVHLNRAVTMALAATLAACQSAPQALPQRSLTPEPVNDPRTQPAHPRLPELGRVPGLGFSFAIELVLSHIERNYDGLESLRPDVMWTDSLDRLQHALPQVPVKRLGERTLIDDPTRGKPWIRLNPPETLDALRLDLRDVLQYYRATLRNQNAAPGAPEQLIAAGILCNMDSDTRLLSPRQMVEMFGPRSAQAEKVKPLFDLQPDLISEARCKPIASDKERESRGSRADSLEWGVFYTSPDGFGAGFSEGLAQRISQARHGVAENLTGIVLDLRGCPGGLFSEILPIADLFLPAGDAFALVSRKDGIKKSSTTTDGHEIEVPLIVLIDSQCASGCELLASTLRERERTILIGTTTMGKGAVQIVLNLRHPLAGMKLTSAHMRTSTGKTLEKTGVAPDVVVIDGEAATASSASAASMTITVNANALPAFAISVVKRSKGASPSALLAAVRELVPR
jgi:hypothetical protein